jgi:hypothetical protein
MNRRPEKGTILRDVTGREYEAEDVRDSDELPDGCWVRILPHIPPRAFEVGNVLAKGSTWGVVDSHRFNHAEWRWEYFVYVPGLDNGVLWHEPSARLIAHAAKELPR